MIYRVSLKPKLSVEFTYNDEQLADSGPYSKPLYELAQRIVNELTEHEKKYPNLKRAPQIWRRVLSKFRKKYKYDHLDTMVTVHFNLKEDGLVSYTIHSRTPVTYNDEFWAKLNTSNNEVQLDIPKAETTTSSDHDVYIEPETTNSNHTTSIAEQPDTPVTEKVGETRTVDFQLTPLPGFELPDENVPANISEEFVNVLKLIRCPISQYYFTYQYATIGNSRVAILNVYDGRDIPDPRPMLGSCIISV